jgi:uncharacterized membrane protein
VIVRSAVLFVHLLGMLVLFGGLGLEWLTLRILRRSTTREEALPWVGVYAALPRAIGIAVGLILISGIYLAARAHVYDSGWVRVSFGAMAFMAILGGPVVRSRTRAIRQAGGDDRDRGSGTLQRHASDPLLRASLFIRVAVALAIVYLMISKPSLNESLLLIGVAFALGAAISVPQRRAQSSAVGV